MKVQTSLACWPGLWHEDAAREASRETREPLFGRLGVEHVQIVPQSLGPVTAQVIGDMRACLPGTNFRFHANVRLGGPLDSTPHPRVYDLSTFSADFNAFSALAQLNHAYLLSAPYTAHAGRRKNCSVRQLLDNVRKCEDLFGSPVGVEGHYPSAEDFLIDSWSEYEAVLESGVHFAVDLSHLNIVVHHEGRQDDLVRAMLSSPKCIEVHVSDNDGTGDWHQIAGTIGRYLPPSTEEIVASAAGFPGGHRRFVARPIWWRRLLDYVHLASTVFSEGNHRRKRNANT